MTQLMVWSSLCLALQVASVLGIRRSAWLGSGFHSFHFAPFKKGCASKCKLPGEIVDSLEYLSNYTPLQGLEAVAQATDSLLTLGDLACPFDKDVACYVKCEDKEEDNEEDSPVVPSAVSDFNPLATLSDDKLVKCYCKKCPNAWKARVMGTMWKDQLEAGGTVDLSQLMCPVWAGIQCILTDNDCSNDAEGTNTMWAEMLNYAKANGDDFDPQLMCIGATRIETTTTETTTTIETTTIAATMKGTTTTIKTTTTITHISEYSTITLRRWNSKPNCDGRREAALRFRMACTNLSSTSVKYTIVNKSLKHHLYSCLGCTCDVETTDLATLGQCFAGVSPYYYRYSAS